MSYTFVLSHILVENNRSEKSKFDCLGMFNYVVKFVGGEQWLVLVACKCSFEIVL